MSSFRIIDIAPETIIQTALNAAIRSHSMSEATSSDGIAKALGIKAAQAKDALSMAQHLRLVSGDNRTGYTYSGDLNLRIAGKQDLPQFFRNAIQQFPPYLLYVSFLTRGYSENEAVGHTASVFDLALAPQRIVAIFRRWSRYSGIMDNSGILTFEPKEILSIGFLSRLAEALQDDLATKTFVINEIGNAIAARMYADGFDLDAIARALIEHSRSPSSSVQEVANLVESYLASISSSLGGPTSELGKILDYLSGKERLAILRTHRNLGYGVTGLRNAANHGSDPDDEGPWELATEAALVGALLSMLLLRSVARYRENGLKQV